MLAANGGGAGGRVVGVITWGRLWYFVLRVPANTGLAWGHSLQVAKQRQASGGDKMLTPGIWQSLFLCPSGGTRQGQSPWKGLATPHFY